MVVYVFGVIPHVRVAVFRFGVVLGNGGALKKMLTPFRLGLGGILGTGKQHFSFIHVKDLLNAYKFIIDNEKLDGVFNLVAPNTTTNAYFTKALGKVLHRPTFLPISESILKFIFGQGAMVLCDGQKVLPTRLLENGFKFKFDKIDQSLKDLIGDKI